MFQLSLVKFSRTFQNLKTALSQTKVCWKQVGENSLEKERRGKNPKNTGLHMEPGG